MFGYKANDLQFLLPYRVFYLHGRIILQDEVNINIYKETSFPVYMKGISVLIKGTDRLPVFSIKRKEVSDSLKTPYEVIRSSSIIP